MLYLTFSDVWDKGEWESGNQAGSAAVDYDIVAELVSGHR